MSKRSTWTDIKKQRPLSEEGRAAYADEARISAFRELVYRLRTEAGLTQAELAERMGTTQSAIARMEGGGTRPTLETLEKVAERLGATTVVTLTHRDSTVARPSHCDTFELVLRQRPRRPETTPNCVAGRRDDWTYTGRTSTEERV